MDTLVVTLLFPNLTNLLSINMKNLRETFNFRATVSEGTVSESLAPVRKTATRIIRKEI